MANYGPPLLDFSPLGNLAKTFFDARDEAEDRTQKRELRASLASLGQNGNDYEAMGRKMLSLGDISNGIGFLKLAQDEKNRRAQASADASAFGLAYGNGSPIAPAPSYGTSTGTPRANIDNNTVHVAESEDDVQRLERAMGQRLDPQDLDAVTRTVSGEAQGEGPLGQVAVANVIANRARQSGMTPADVVMAKGQFEPWSDPEARARMQSMDPNSPKYQALAGLVAPVLQGQAADPTGGATHFYAPKAQAALGRSAPSWDDGTGRDIGNHRFFAHGYGPQGRVQVAQADVPAPGSQQADFIIPGQGGAPSPRIANLERALANPNLSSGARQALQSRLDREYKLQDDAGKKTELQRNYEAAVSQGFNGSIVDYQTAIRRSGAPVVNNNIGAGDDFYKELDKKSATMFSTLEDEGYKAQSKMAQIERLDGLLTAAQSNPLPALRQAAGEWGIKTEGLSDIQAAQALINQLVPQQRPAGSGTMSDADLDLYKQSIPRLVNQPGGNKIIIDTMRGITQYTAEQGAIARDVANRVISPKEGRERLGRLQNPLANFKQIAGTGQPSPSAPGLLSPQPTGGVVQGNGWKIIGVE